MLKSVEKFINGEITKTSETNKYIFLSNGEKYNKKFFNQSCQVARVYINKLNTPKTLGNIPEIAKIVNNAPVLGSVNPTNAMRYIILSNGKEFKMYFAKGFTSHSSLFEEFDKQCADNDYWSCVGGGFYCYIASNAIPEGSERSIMLFGKSDSYGLRKENLDKAIKTLPQGLNVIILEKLPQSITDNTEVIEYSSDKCEECGLRFCECDLTY
jgi:hypothetical protein